MFYVNKKFFFVSLIVCTVIGLVMGILLLSSIALKKEEPTAEIVEEVTEEKHETVISVDVIKEGLNGIGELASQEYLVTAIGEYKDSNPKVNIFGWNPTEKSFSYSYDGIVKAGIDFTKIDIEVDNTNKIIRIILPDAEILSTEIDYDSFESIDENNSLLNLISIKGESPMS